MEKLRERCKRILRNNIRDGYVKNQRLDEVIITPTTKGETDELIDAEGIVSSGLMTSEEWETCVKDMLLHCLDTVKM